MPNSALHLTIANSVVDLVQGDIKEHLPMERILLTGDVLGLGTTTSTDNGELAFAYDPDSEQTGIYKCHANTGGIHKVCQGDGSDHFPYACYTSDARGLGYAIDLTTLASRADWQLKDWVEAGIVQLNQRAEIYGVRVRCSWERLMITVASKLCMGQRNRNSVAAQNAGAGAAIYDALQHYLLADGEPDDLAANVRYLGDSLVWECCGFYDTDPEAGRVTVAQADAHLHMHGLSIDAQFGGHLHHEHPMSALSNVAELIIYPIESIEHLGSDLAVTDWLWDAGELTFTVSNLGHLDVHDIGIDVVPDDCYSARTYLRLPWLGAGDSETFSLRMTLAAGPHRLLVAVDPTCDVIEPEDSRSNNRVVIDINV